MSNRAKHQYRFRKSPLDRPVKLPAHAIYVHWDFGRDALCEMSFDITMHNDPGTSVGEYFSPYNGSIDGHQIYFGIQTDVYRPGKGGIGKGCIFSTWWTFDAHDTRPTPEGFIQLGTHEGRFVGVRHPYEWGVGDFRLTVRRAEPEGDGDWFEMVIQPIEPLSALPDDPALKDLSGGDRTTSDRPEPIGPEVLLGALRFRRANPDIPATIRPYGPAFLEVYSDAETYRQIAPWTLDVMAFGDGKRARSLRTEYPAYPHARVPNANVAYLENIDRVCLSFGGDQACESAPSSYP